MRAAKRSGFRVTIRVVRRPGGMALWREKLFALMSRNSQQASAYYQIPSDRVIELGGQVRL